MWQEKRSSAASRLNVVAGHHSVEVIRACCGGNPAALKRLYGRFTAMIIPGSTIKVVLHQPQNGIVGFTVFNEVGQAAVSNGIAVIG